MLGGCQGEVQMIQLSQGAGEVVAGDIRSALEAYDNAMLSSARVSASSIEAMMGAGVPAGQSQRLLASIVASMGSVVEGRSRLVDAIRHMLEIKDGSTLMSSDFGCPTGAARPLEIEPGQARAFDRV